MIVGLAAAVVILLLTFGTAVAMGIPIVTALLGLGVGLSIVTLISHLAEVPTSAPALATMIGLGSASTTPSSSSAATAASWRPGSS